MSRDCVLPQFAFRLTCFALRMSTGHSRVVLQGQFETHNTAFLLPTGWILNLFKLALRDDAKRDPPDQAKPGREMSARAARGCLQQRAIAPQESPKGVGVSAPHGPLTRTR